MSDTDGAAALKSLMAEGAPPGGTQASAIPAPAKPVAPSAPVNQPPMDDVTPAYMAHRDDLEGRAALASLQSEGPQQPPQGTPAGQTPVQTPQPAQAGIGATAAGVGKDVGTGLTEAPRAIGQGVRNAFQNMLSGAQDLGDWLQSATQLPGLKIDSSGVHVISADELKTLREQPGDTSVMDFKKAPLPGMTEPTSVTGKVIESTAQFITSMATLGRVFGPMGTDMDGVLGHLATAGKGAAALFAGFDKADGNIADLVQSVPALKNPITEFMSSQPGDNEAVGRLKNAVMGAGFGELADGLISGLGMLREGLTAKGQVGDLAPTKTGEPVNTPAVFKFLGDPDAPPDAPLASFKTETPEQGKAARAQQATEGLTPEQVGGMTQPSDAQPKVNINFARIDTPDDVKNTMQQLADAQSSNIQAAQRGIQSFEATKLGAQFTDVWSTLMDRRIGQPLNASEQLAGRQLLAESAMMAEKLTAMTLENPTPENLFAWRKQMQTHAMIQAEVSGSQTEIARSLGAMRIPVSGQGSISRMAAITSQLDQMGGLKSNMDFLTATKSLIDAGKLEDLGNVAEKSMYAKTRDGLITAWTNGLLTNPMTHVKVNLSNIATIVLRLAETRFAESMDSLTDHNGVPVGEAAQTTAGLISGIKDSFRYLGKLAGIAKDAPESNPITDAANAFKTGHYSVGEQTPDWAQAGQGASDALSIADSSWVGKATDMLSSVVTSPGRALAGEHEFYRSIGMRMELNRYAYRQAMSEVNSGKITSEDLAGRVQQLVETPPQGLNTKAIDGMTYQTFTDAPGKLADSLEKIRNDFPLVRVIMPFYKIPSRIMSFTFERSPFAPLMAGWRADIAAGGARQSMALAKTGIGSMVMLATSDAVLNSQITGQGPSDKGQRLALQNEGWQPYSIKLPGGRWVQYNRLETVGSSIAMAADLVETTRDYFTAVNKDDPNVEKLTAAGIAALANNVTSKTYFEGVARFFETLSDPKANAEGMLKSLAGSVVPAGVSAVTRLMDPYQRATYSMMDAIKARTPGVSSSLPPLRNLWGEPVRHDSGLGKPYDAFVPFATHQPGDEPIDAEIQKQGFHFSLPEAKTSFGSGATVDLKNDPALYSRYVELAGNELKDRAWGVGAKDLMNQIVSGNHPLSTIYNMKSDGPDGGKYVMLRGLLEQYRNQARTQLMNESPELHAQVQQAQQKQSELKMTAMQ